MSNTSTTMVELKKTSSRATSAVSQRQLINTCAASIASLLMLQKSVVAFAPSATTGFVTSTPEHYNRFINRGTRRHINIYQPTPKSLVSRSAVIQSYRIEDDPNVSTSDAFSFLPSRLSSIERLETPSDFKSVVMDEQDSLVVVRFSADTCPSCRSTSHLFRKWSRDNETPSNDRKLLEVKVVEMPLNKATSAFMQDKLRVDQLPYCHLYHPQMGLVEEQLVMNKIDFRDFVDVVEKWAAGLVTADYDSCILCSKDELIDDCQEFC